MFWTREKYYTKPSIASRQSRSEMNDEEIRPCLDFFSDERTMRMY